jgi:hypothetical protein
MPCIHRLDPKYIGLYCIYCGAEVATISDEDGQIALERNGRKRYVAVVFDDKQKQIFSAKVNQTTGETDITFDVRGEFVWSPKTQHLLKAFQEPEERFIGSSL